MGSHEVEEQLNKVKNWIEAVKTNIDKEMITSNRLFKIDCRPCEMILVPKLEQIYVDICECILNEIQNDTNNFIKIINHHLKVKNHKNKN
jgi:hypothetical protein